MKRNIIKILHFVTFLLFLLHLVESPLQHPHLFIVSAFAFDILSILLRHNLPHRHHLFVQCEGSRD